MLYKEWTTVRVKFMVHTVIYAGIAMLVLYFWESPSYSHSLNPYNNSYFMDWIWAALGLTVITGILAGVDTVAEETDKNTITFLLTRPISRRQVYRTKIGLNLAALLATLIPISLLMMLRDWQHHNPVNLFDSLTGLLMVASVGVAVTCLSSLISIFTRNTITSLVVNMLAAIFIFFLVVFLLIALSNAFTGIVDVTADYAFYFQLLRPGNLFLAAALFTGLVAAGLYKAGLFLFEKREF